MGMAMTSCDENSWNDKLDGFDGNASTTEVKNIEYTLTKTDYSTIASLDENVALAGTANASALAAVKTQCAFSEAIPAREYVPAFLASSKFSYFTLDDGSTVKVKYNVSEGLPAVLSEIAGAENVTITKADYQDAWGSEEDFIEGFAPSVAPSKYIPKYLDAPDEDGSDYAMVTYNYSEQEPVFIGGEVPEYYLVSSVPSGVPVLLVADGNAALAPSGSYGYLNGESVTVEGDVVKGSPSDEAFFTFTATDGGYYMQDANGRYFYMTGTYNNFNLTSSVPTSGGVWSIAFDANGDCTITNVEKGKYLQWDSTYGSYGAYDSARGTLPKMYTDVAQSKTSRSLAAPVTTSVAYGLYKYSGSAWAEDTSVDVIQPSDYSQMGLSSNFIPSADASKYLPIYCQQKYPYASKNTTKTIVYFSSSSKAITATELTFNGTEWTVYTGIVERTLKFEKTNGVWGIAPGLATFTHTRVDAITSGDKYLIVTGTNAATILNATYTYGYLQPTTLESDEENVNLADAEDCEFTITLTDNGYTIQDRYGRYYYQSGTYNSFNVSTELASSSSNGYYWEFTFNEDGTVAIENTLVNKTIQYDESYSSYGSYANITHELPMLYVAVGD